MTLFEFVRKRVSDLTMTESEQFKRPTEIIHELLQNPTRIQDLYFQIQPWIQTVTLDSLRATLVDYNRNLDRIELATEGNFTNRRYWNGYLPDKNGGGVYGLYYQSLQKNGFLAQSDLDRVDDECKLIAQQFFPIQGQNIDRRGLVIGQVQSGKTTIFNGLISIAADMGFNLIIILSGTIENLRQQTQSRILRDVTEVWGANPGRPFQFTWISNHLGPGLSVAGNANNVLADLENQKGIGVFLKNPNVLRNLKRWLNTLNKIQHDKLKVLIIDDEADQATPNAGVGKNTITAINKLIKSFVNETPNSICPTQARTTYLGFTATPFANLLNEAGPNTLYPRDFLYFLKSSEKYFGPMQLFGNPNEVEGEETVTPLNVVRILNDEDINGTVPEPGSSSEFDPRITAGLRESILWFILASTARRTHKQDSWSTMLVHTSSRISHHFLLAEVISFFISEVYYDFDKNNGRNFLNDLEKLWQKEVKTVGVINFEAAFPNYGTPPANYPSWNQITQNLPQTIKCIRVKIDNSIADESERMRFGEKTPNEDRIQIAVGGNTLSRGITLEGLVSSYFARRFNAQGCYDTLLQMGRWFGYRKDYELLPRLWTTSTLINSFRDLVVMELALRDQMNIYLRGESPAERAPVISQMPAMAITRKAVIGNINIGEVNYAGSAPQTILFNNDRDWLQNNIFVTRDLLEKTRTYLHKPVQSVPNKVYYTKVPREIVVSFLNNYNVLPDSNVFNKTHIIDYISISPNCENWTIVVTGGTSSEKFETAKGIVVNKNRRTRIIEQSGTTNRINLKSLRSTTELLIDREDLMPKATTARDITTLWTIRRKNNLNPVLIVYPIDRNSQLLPGSADNRASLEGYAVEDIIGISLILDPPSETKIAAHGVSLANIQSAGYETEGDELP
jgi:hypothetical protein